eukprot:scaffold130736_cov89-Cyclotella_meneghiniana.AAC.1
MADSQQQADLYDEFGNYIGPDLDSSDDSSSDEEDDNDNNIPSDASEVSDMSRDGTSRALVQHTDLGETSAANAIVLHEDK